MAVPASLDWIFLLGGIAIGLGGFALVILALFRGRSRGRRRCPKCWYDMSGAPGLMCPECGRTARNERRLYRTRRRWKRAGVGLIVVFMGVCTAEVPTYKRGWTALVPTTILAAFAPAKDPTRVGFPGLGPRAVVTTTLNGQLVIAPPPPMAPAATSIPQQLTDEFWKRLETRKTRGWQSRLYFSRYFKNRPVEFGDYLTVPDRWPLGVPIRVSMRTVLAGPVAGAGIETIARRAGSEQDAFGNGAGFIEGTAVATEEIEVEMRLQYMSQVLHRTTVRVPIKVSGSMATFLEQLKDEASTAMVRQAINPRLAWDAEDPVLKVNDRSDSQLWRRIDFGVAYRVDLYLGEQLLGTGAGAADWLRPVWKDWDEIRFSMVEGGRERAAAAPEQIRVVISGDPAAAGRMYMDAPFGKRGACWAGKMELAPAAESKANRP